MALLAAGCERFRERRPKRVGMALGGGGAKGLAHIPFLETLDELGIRPYRIAGTSIGAIIGALYASGLSGKDIRGLVDRLMVSEKEGWAEALFRKDVLKWIEFIDPDLGRGGLIDSEAFLAYLEQALQATSFDDLEIPLQVVAADFWKREQVIFSSGELSPAIKASMALPGLFSPVTYRGRVLVDGGLVNPVPYDLLMDDCDVVIAIDVIGTRVPDEDGVPSYLETVFNGFQIMQQAIMTEKLKHQRPTVYLKPELAGFRVLEFYRAEEIYRQTGPASRTLKRRLQSLLS
jgi:NTE family protein